MIIGDLGAEVIKVEPVTGDGMRMASKPFFGCQRGKRDIALNVKDPRGLAIALELVATADIVHHNMTAGVATKLGIDYAACQAGEARHRLLQHVGVRPRRPARPLRRSRPAVPGVVGARVRVGRGARRQHAALLPLRHVRRVERDAVGRRGARRALSPQAHRRGPRGVDVAVRRRRDLHLRRASRRAASPRRVRTSTRS